MATPVIRELWIPSPHNSSPRGAYLKGAFHTTEGAQKIRDLGSWFQNPSAGCSSHHGSDNYERGLFGAYVYEDRKAWTQGNGNSVCLSLEQCTPSGAASNWSRDTWLSKTILIDNAAEWMHYMAEKYKLPYKWLNNSETQDTWSKGFCEHVNGGSSWSGHHDCGNGFPNDVVLDKARSWGSGSGGGTTPSEEDVLLKQIYLSASESKPHKINTAGQWSAVSWDSWSPDEGSGGTSCVLPPAARLFTCTFDMYVDGLTPDDNMYVRIQTLDRNGNQLALYPVTELRSSASGQSDLSYSRVGSVGDSTNLRVLVSATVPCTIAKAWWRVLYQ